MSIMTDWRSSRIELTGKATFGRDDLAESAPEIAVYTGFNARVTRKDIPTGTFHYGRGKTGGI